MRPRSRPGRARGEGPPGPQEKRWVHQKADALAPYAEEVSPADRPPWKGSSCWPRECRRRTKEKWEEEEREDFFPLDNMAWHMGVSMNVLAHRHSLEGLMATGFEPQRHSWVVQGRPVQAASRGARAPSAAVWLPAHSVNACALHGRAFRQPWGAAPMTQGQPTFAPVQLGRRLPHGAGAFWHCARRRVLPLWAARAVAASHGRRARVGAVRPRVCACAPDVTRESVTCERVSPRPLCFRTTSRRYKRPCRT